MKQSKNWEHLKIKIAPSNGVPSRGRKKEDDSKSLNDAINHMKTATSDASKPVVVHIHLPEKEKIKYVGLDCEMVGIGADGKVSALARCCVVDFDGVVLYDEYVKPPGFVTDFRTQWSGIRKQDLRVGKAISLLECQTAVASLLKGKILVGHGLQNDLTALLLSHPRRMIRDTARYRPLMRPHGKKFRPRALRDLVKQHLNMIIQTGEHDPGEDARAAMMLYRFRMKQWEKELREIRFKGKSEVAGLSSSISDDKVAADHDDGDEGGGGVSVSTNLKRSAPLNQHQTDSDRQTRNRQKKSKMNSSGMFLDASRDSSGRPLKSISEVQQYSSSSSKGSRIK